LKILGIDPGLINTGYGIVEPSGSKVALIDYGVVQPSKSDQLSVRLKVICNDVLSIIKEFKPNVCVVEEVFYSKNFKSSLLLGQARAAVLIASAMQGVDIAEYSARKIKQSITGNGNSSKEQIQFMVKNILEMNEVPKPVDASDALAIAICHHHHNNLL
tara:strand:- start:107 stop:583 length:477 start_codon:yes stop_codon:yes gene_type:complete